MSLWNWKLGILIILAIIGFFLYKKYPVHMLMVVPSGVIIGTVQNFMILGYTYEISFAEISIITLCLYFIINALIQKKLSFRLSSIGFMLGLYMLLNIISILWSWDGSRTMIAIRVLLYHFLLYCLVINIIREKEDAKKAIMALPIAAFLIALQLLYTVFGLGGLGRIIVPREQIITSAGPYVTISAMIFLCVPIALWHMYQQKNSKRKNIIAICIGIGVIAGFLALGKAEIGALMIGVFYFLKKSNKLKPKYFLILACVGCISLFTPILNYALEFWKRIQETIQGSDSLAFRLQEWRIGAQSFLEKPFLGVGAGNLKTLFRMKHPCHCATEANNVILHIGVEFGIIGLMMFAVLLRDIWARLQLLMRSEAADVAFGVALKTSIIMLMIISMAEVTFVGLNFGILFWYLIGIIAASSESLITNKKI